MFHLPFPGQWEWAVAEPGTAEFFQTHATLTGSWCPQVIRHLRTNKPCAPTSTAAENVPTPPPPGRPEEAPPPQSPLLEPHPLKTHTCFQCDAVFRSDAELLVHQRSHRTRTVYQCDQCRKTFHHLSSLSNHKQAYLARGAFTCSRAEKETEPPPEPPRLQHHLACTVCHQTFSSQTLLLRHMQTHSAEGVEPRYSCRFCEQTFSGRPPRHGSGPGPSLTSNSHLCVPSRGDPAAHPSALTHSACVQM